MKKIINIAVAMAVVAIFFAGCKKDEISPVVTKNVVYEIKKNNPQTDTEHIIWEGTLVDFDGREFAYADKLDWKKTLENVPANIKLGFKGQLKGDNLKKIDVTISMIVTDAKTGRVIHEDKKVIHSVKDVASGEGFTAYELKEKTSFSFKEN